MPFRFNGASKSILYGYLLELVWYIKDGFDMGRRENLTGSGLRRSAGGWEGVLKLRRTEEYWRGDEYWLAAILK